MRRIATRRWTWSNFSKAEPRVETVENLLGTEPNIGDSHQMENDRS